MEKNGKVNLCTLGVSGLKGNFLKARRCALVAFPTLHTCTVDGLMSKYSSYYLRR